MFGVGVGDRDILIAGGIVLGDALGKRIEGPAKQHVIRGILHHLYL